MNMDIQIPSQNRNGTFSPEQIDAIKSKFKRGDMARIAQATGNTTGYISRIFDIEDPAYSHDVIEWALNDMLEQYNQTEADRVSIEERICRLNEMGS